MKARVCFATEVVESDSFLSMSLTAQLCYFHLCSEARPSGLVVGASRIVRGYGFTMDEVDELLTMGFLLDVDGELFVRDTWVNNAFDGRLFERVMAGCEPYKSGRLAFAGEVGKSRYVIIDDQSTLNRRSIDHEVIGSECDSEGNGGDFELSGMEFENEAKGSGGIQGGEGGTLHPCLCTRCGGEATYSTLNNKTTIRCPSCGEYPFSV